MFFCDSLIGKYGRIPAHLAVKEEYKRNPPQDSDKLKAILEACPACIDVQNNVGNTPLHIAVIVEDEECANVLVSAGCNPLIKGQDRGTAYDHAIWRTAYDHAKKFSSSWKIRELLKPM